MNFCAKSRVAIVVALGVLSTAAAAAQLTRPDWHVDSLKETITVNPDSSLLVDETQAIPENDRNFGLRCDLPIGSEDRWDRTYHPVRTDDNGLRVKVLKVTVDGTPVTFHIDHYKHTFYQVIVDRGNSIEPGSHVLNVVYRVTGAIQSEGANDQLYWNVAGHKLSVRYDSQSVRVFLPDGVPAESVRASSYAGGFNPPTASASFSNGQEFSIDKAGPRQSMSITVRWPQGYIHRDTFQGQYGLPYSLAPLLLVIIYIAIRIFLRRNVEPRSTVPQYEPPAGLSPAALRYVIHGVVDGTSIAASLADLAVQGYIEVQAKGASFVLRRTSKCDTDKSKLPAEEAAIAELLFDPSADVADPVCGLRNDYSGSDYQDLSALNARPSAPRTQWKDLVVFGPNDPRMNVLTGTISTRVKPQLDGKYFTWNAWIALAGMLATLVFGLTAVLRTGQESNSLFLVVWSFLFFQIFSAIMSFSLFSRQRNGAVVALTTLGFVGATFLAARQLAQDLSWAPVASYSAMMITNALFLPLLRTPNAEGQKLLFQIRGYKMFLQATELDRLKEFGKNSAATPKAASLPYAIALDLKEPWGDAMATTFASAAASV
jgi:Predicted membrane protein (DUF2207)